ncbi:MAG: M24 family metallopeptidase [Candidatus Woesearchaeota archaeon]
MEKIKQLKKLLKKYDANQIVIQAKDPNFYWLIQRNITGAILIITQKDTTLIAKPLEHIPSNLQNQIKVIKIKKTSEIKKIAKDKIRGKTLLNYTETTLKDLHDLNIKKTQNITKELAELRQTKTLDEIKKIKIACNHTVKCWKDIIKKLEIKELKSEKQIETHIQKYALENNLDLAFSPVVASGNNASVPHHKPEKKLKKGFLVIDMGFTYEGYKSDMTRTIYLGKITKEEKQIYEELLNIQKEMIKRAKPGKSAQKLQEETQTLMGKNKELFIHGLGHGVGVYIHEKPSILEQSEDKIGQNNVLTIEPGYYTKKYGIRIEDTILIGQKNQILTEKATKKLKIIK